MMAARLLKSYLNPVTNCLAKKYSNLSALIVLNSKSAINSDLKSDVRTPNFSSRLIRKLPITSSFHTSSQLYEIKGLYEFFDEKENWGANEVKVGRSWRKQELRIKSNEDLHKLWYVLLKEKNMLLTMEEASKREFKLFPNPERIDKVEESMSNLEEVVRERNRAYMLLETGETGERPGGFVVDSFGRKAYRRYAEYTIPDYMHTRVMNSPFARNPIKTQFSRLLREKAIKLKRREKNRKKRYVAKLFQRFPDINVEALKQKYPDVDVDKVRTLKLSRGNHDKNIA